MWISRGEGGDFWIELSLLHPPKGTSQMDLLTLVQNPRPYYSSSVCLHKDALYTQVATTSSRSESVIGSNPGYNLNT